MKLCLPESELSFIKSLFFKIEKSILITSTIFLVVGQGLYVLLPGLLGLLIDKIFVLNSWSISFLMLFPAIWFASVICSSLGKIYSSRVVQDVRKASKAMVFSHLIHLPNTAYTTRGAGEIENLMQELSLNSRYMFSENFPFFIRVFVSILVAMSIIWMSSVDLLPIFLGWAFLYIPISYLTAKKSIKHVADSLTSGVEVSATTVDIIQNHELIPAFGTEKFEILRFNQLLNQERHCYNKAQQAIDMADFFQRILQALLPLSIVSLLIYSEKYLKMTPGSIASLFSVTLIVTAQIGDFGKGILAFLEMKERMRNALIKLAYPSSLRENCKKHQTMQPATWDIHFENVYFSYTKEHLGIQNINIHIKENEKIGLVGYSGAGKTTLIKLLRGFVKPSNGTIYIGEVELDKIDPNYLTQNIAEVSQSIPLFHRTIRENVAYGCENITDEKIWEILEKAQMLECVTKLPKGLDTIVGVKGQKLSGGERARLGIARAFIRNAKIIILDEATAAVDSESELLLQKSLRKLMKGRTVIAIAHRLSTLREMQKIIVLDKGQITTVGTHQELIKHNELYNRLWSTQILV